MVSLEREKAGLQAQLQQQWQARHEDAERAAEQNHAARESQRELFSTVEALDKVRISSRVEDGKFMF